MDRKTLMKWIAFAALAGFGSGTAIAQNASSDWSSAWGFQSPGDRAVDLATALAQKRLENGTDGNRVQVTNNVSSTQNIQGGLTSIELDGNGHVVEVGQSSSGEQNATATTEVEAN